MVALDLGMECDLPDGSGGLSCSGTTSIGTYLALVVTGTALGDVAEITVMGQGHASEWS